jgi:hypothetical protein
MGRPTNHPRAAFVSVFRFRTANVKCLDPTPDFRRPCIPRQTHRIVSASELFDQMLRES